MEYKVHSVLIGCMVFVGAYVLTSASPLVGEAVRSAAEGEFPFVVSIVYTHATNTRLFKHFCTGTLVSNKDVITADHCLHNKEKYRVKVLVGSADLRQTVKCNVAWWIDFESWANNKGLDLQYEINDIAVIRLMTPLPDSIQPAALTTLTNAELTGLNVSLAGWGRKENGKNPIIMDTVAVQVVGVNDCEQRIENIQGRPIYFEYSVFCTTADPYALVHQGDSGGPVIYGNTLIGITKGTCPFPEINIHPQKLNIHFGLFHYREFILSIINYNI